MTLSFGTTIVIAACVFGQFIYRTLRLPVCYATQTRKWINRLIDSRGVAAASTAICLLAITSPVSSEEQSNYGTHVSDILFEEVFEDGVQLFEIRRRTNNNLLFVFFGTSNNELIDIQISSVFAATTKWISETTPLNIQFSNSAQLSEANAAFFRGDYDTLLEIAKLIDASSGYHDLESFLRANFEKKVPTCETFLIVDEHNSILFSITLIDENVSNSLQCMNRQMIKSLGLRNVNSEEIKSIMNQSESDDYISVTDQYLLSILYDQRLDEKRKYTFEEVKKLLGEGL